MSTSTVPTACRSQEEKCIYAEKNGTQDEPEELRLKWTLSLTSQDLTFVPMSLFPQPHDPPHQLHHHPQLRHLDLSRNSLSELPPELGTLIQLQTLNVNRNRLKVLPPAAIGTLVHLVELHALSNQLRPHARSLPLSELKDLSLNHSLRYLDLRFNSKLKMATAEALKECLSDQVVVCLTFPTENNTNAIASSKSRIDQPDQLLPQPDPNPKVTLHACDRDATLLQSQLEPLSTPTLRKRLERDFGHVKLDPDRYGRDIIMSKLLEAYDVVNNHLNLKKRPRLLFQGVPVSPGILDALLVELHQWVETCGKDLPRERPKIQASHYMILRSQEEFTTHHSKKAQRAASKLQKHQKLWDLATMALQEVDLHFHSNQFTALAVTHNFVGSPHIDTQNIGPFYGLSLGDYFASTSACTTTGSGGGNNNIHESGSAERIHHTNTGKLEDNGGRLCVEWDYNQVAEVDTRGRLAKIDGRFVHWVAPYEGERFSLIYYQTLGDVIPQTKAVLPVPNSISNNSVH